MIGLKTRHAVLGNLGYTLFFLFLIKTHHVESEYFRANDGSNDYPLYVVRQYKNHTTICPPKWSNLHFLTAVKTIISDEICDIFLMFAQNKDCGYLLEPPRF